MKSEEDCSFCAQDISLERACAGSTVEPRPGLHRAQSARCDSVVASGSSRHRKTSGRALVRVGISRTHADQSSLASPAAESLWPVHWAATRVSGACVRLSSCSPTSATQERKRGPLRTVERALARRSAPPLLGALLVASGRRVSRWVLVG